MNVLSFQCPWGVFPISRLPLGARPRKRVIFVVVAVSSMKTSCLGSIEGCLSRHSSRAALTSSRSCSAACRFFYSSAPDDRRSATKPTRWPQRFCPQPDAHGFSISVRSGCLATSASSQSLCASIARERRSPPVGLACQPPVSWKRYAQRIALLTLTLNAALAPRREIPAFTAPITRYRKSAE